MVYTPPMVDIDRLLNLGPQSAKWLKRVGIETRDDLERVGPLQAFTLVRDREPKVTLNLLWALVGALEGYRWDEVPEELKALLLQELDEE